MDKVLKPTTLYEVVANMLALYPCIDTNIWMLNVYLMSTDRTYSYPIYIILKLIVSRVKWKHVEFRLSLTLCDSTLSATSSVGGDWQAHVFPLRAFWSCVLALLRPFSTTNMYFTWWKLLFMCHQHFQWMLICRLEADECFEAKHIFQIIWRLHLKEG